MSKTADALRLGRQEDVTAAFDVDSVRADFPALRQTVNGKPLVYLDNAATTQKPSPVIEAVRHFYEVDCSNVHRGVHSLSERATREYEAARVKVQRFINAAHAREVIFVRGTTEAINLVAQTYGRAHVGEGDEILITSMEHHSNIVPWQILCAEKGARLRVAPVNDSGELVLPELEKLLGPRTRLVAVVQVSNALGTINPIQRVVEMAHRHDVPVLVDGAQAVPHFPVDVQALGCDFYAFSGHKLYAPMGVGVLYGKAKLLEAMPPYQGGGDMIISVTFEKTSYNSLPFKFEAGTPNVAGAVGLGTAIDYVGGLTIAAVESYERDLLAYAMNALRGVRGVRVIGAPREQAGAISFLLDGVHPHDLGTILDQQGIAIRAGHHCAQPLMRRFGVAATARASFAFYNTSAEVDAFVEALGGAREMFR